ncbi:MAG: HlyD family efflux transporter periplasmic adaptor subunit [Magnetococcales bacterium]|nr:HlyD family efflux transporter periplasmic adaptor subunit [Magnetococcales bacterium]
MSEGHPIPRISNDTEGDPRPARLAALLDLEQEARHAADLAAFGFVVVNRTIRLFPYRIAVFWRVTPTGKRIEAISGVPSPESDAPFGQWLDRVFRHLAPLETREPRRLHPEDLPETLANEWQEWVPPFSVEIPLIAPSTGNRVLGGVWFAHEEGWSDEEIALGKRLADGYAETLSRFLPTSRNLVSRFRSRRLEIAVLLLLVLVSLLPVRLSVLAPAEIAAIDPVAVTVPRDGVIAAVAVLPDRPVDKGDLLFSLDETDVRGKREIARQAFHVAEAEYQNARVSAFQEQESKTELGVLQAKLEKARLEFEYATSLLERSRVFAPKEGVLVYRDVNDWLGKPVKLGERVAFLDDPDQVEVHVRLPVADAIVLEPGSDIRMFLNISPLNPLKGKLRQVSYEAVVSPNNILTYLLKASLEKGADSPPPRIGLMGTAKLYGREVTLFYYVMRKPLAAMRQLLGI